MHAGFSAFSSGALFQALTHLVCLRGSLDLDFCYIHRG